VCCTGKQRRCRSWINKGLVKETGEKGLPDFSGKGICVIFQD